MKTVHIIGGGVSGCSLAYFLKEKFKVKLYEKSSVLGGLSRTFYSIENIPYQKGFHVLHTNKQWIINLVKQSGLNIQRVFYDVAMNPLIDFKYYRFPFNQESVNYMPWHWREAALQDFDKISGTSGKNLEEEVINFYGNTIYQIFFKQYIQKLTGYEARDIDEVSWFRRNLHHIDKKSIPFYKEDCYFPINQGWNKLFDYLTKGENVTIETNSTVSFKDFSEDDILVLTVRPDDFADTRRLEYIGFDFEIDSVKYDENKPDTIIFPNDVPFLSMTQYGKLFSPRLHTEEKNIIVKEFTFINQNETAYPILKSENIKKHQELVKNLKSNYRHIYFVGPIATYKNLSMAESIDMAHKISAEIKHIIR